MINDGLAPALIILVLNGVYDGLMLHTRFTLQ